MEELITNYFNGLGAVEYNSQLLALCILIFAVLYKAYKNYHRLRYIADTATSKIASAAQGYIELKGLGEMMEGASIESPFSKKRCLWFNCKIEKKQRSGLQTYWEEDSQIVSENLFYLEDETGLCIVDPEGAFVIPSSKIKWYGSHLGDQYSSGKSGWLTTGKYRFTEKLVFVADALYVMGSFESKRKTINPQLQKEQVESLIKEWKTNPRRYLKKFDIDKNNKIDKKEWVRIREYAQQQVRKKNQQLEYNILKKSGEKNQPFIISTKDEEALLLRKKKEIAGYLVLFFMLLYTLLTALNSKL